MNDARLAALRRSCDLLVMRSYREADRVLECLADTAAPLQFAGAWDGRGYRARAHSVGTLTRDAALIRRAGPHMCWRLRVAWAAH